MTIHAIVILTAVGVCYLDALLPGGPGVLALCGVRRAPLEAEPRLPS